MSPITPPEVDIVTLTPGRAPACEVIGRSLPAWFGVEDGLEELRRCAETQAGFVAVPDSAVVGFVTLARHFPETWEITWMSVAPRWHRRGIGRRLVEAAVARCRGRGRPRCWSRRWPIATPARNSR
jgi:GNAT superfamily N-acetyltransferase